MSSAIIVASKVDNTGSSKLVGIEEDDSEDRILLSPWSADLSCSSLLSLAVLFLLQVASISKSRGAKSSAEVLPRIQEANYYRAVNQDKGLN